MRLARAVLVTTLLLAVVTVVGPRGVDATVPDPGFDDVVPSDPFYDEIAWMTAAGITGGFPDGTFRPTDPVSRQAMAAFFYRLVHEPEPPAGGWPDPGFPDVPSTHPFADEIAWMTFAGITGGFPDGTFRPAQSVSRQAMAAFFQRLETEPGTTIRASLADDEAQGNGDSGVPALSGDGRVVAFHSTAKNLVAGDTNNVSDVFVRDLDAGTTTRVSLRDDDTQTFLNSYNPSISADGRLVAFQSDDGAMVPEDSNGQVDVFVRDLVAGTTTMVSKPTGGDQALGGASQLPTISADGTRVVFVSAATNLVPDDDNGVDDLFVHDLTTGTTTRVSVGTGGVQANGRTFSSTAISDDGSVVAFESEADNLVADDTNDRRDIFVHDLDTVTTTRVSVSSTGVEAEPWGASAPSISGDGNLVAFVSQSNNLVPSDTNNLTDAFLHDRTTGTTIRAVLKPDGSQPTSSVSSVHLSRDGRTLVFRAGGSSFLPSPVGFSFVQVMARDLDTGVNTLISVDSNGVPADYAVNRPAASADGRVIAFFTRATNLVPGDTNAREDVFVHDRFGG